MCRLRRISALAARKLSLQVLEKSRPLLEKREIFGFCSVRLVLKRPVYIVKF